MVVHHWYPTDIETGRSSTGDVRPAFCAILFLSLYGIAFYLSVEEVHTFYNRIEDKAYTQQHLSERYTLQDYHYKDIPIRDHIVKNQVIRIRF